MTVIRFTVLSAILFIFIGQFCKPQDLPDTGSKLQEHSTETGRPGPRTGRLALSCHYVSLDSDDEAFTSEQFRQSVGLEPEFARRGFALSTSLRLADVRVHLGIVTGVVRDRTILLQAWDTRSQTTTQENFPWRERVDGRVIATKVIEMVSKLCGEPRSANLREEPSPEQIAERLGSFHRLQATSRTYFAPKRMIHELSAREEIAEWGITTSTSPESVDVALIIDHLPSISWEYRLVDLKDGALLDSGSVFAIQEERAASRIADLLIIHLAKCRPLRQGRTTPANSGPQNHSSEQFGSWGVTEILESPEPASQKIRLSLQGGSLIGLTSDEQTAFAIDVDSIVDVAFDDTAFIRIVDDPWNMGDGSEASGAAIALGLLLHEVTITKYRIHIAWNEGNVTRLVSLQASKGKLRELFARLVSVAKPLFWQENLTGQ
jgi:hypothetical protein